MTSRLHQLPTVLALVLLGASLAGCASMNERASAAMGDYVPQWAGGLPPDAPPRPGTAKYDEWMKERERLRQMPADQRPEDAQASCGTTKPFAFNPTSSATAKPASNGSTTPTKCPTSSGSTPSGLAPVH